MNGCSKLYHGSLTNSESVILMYKIQHTFCVIFRLFDSTPSEIQNFEKQRAEMCIRHEFHVRISLLFFYDFCLHITNLYFDYQNVFAV